MTVYDSIVAASDLSIGKARVLIDKVKPGGHLLVICTPTKYHRIACDIEDAGFEIRDQMIWLHDGGHKSIVMARKPLSESTVAANVLKHGVGAINIDASRIEAAEGDEPMKWETPRGGIWATDSEATGALVVNNKGRFPANVMHDGGKVAEELDKQSGVKASVRHMSYKRSGGDFIDGIANQEDKAWWETEIGGASRYFKTIPQLLHDDGMVTYLRNMVTPPNGQCLILD